MDRRFFLALLLTMGVIVVTPRLFPGKPRPVVATVSGDSAMTTPVGTPQLRTTYPLSL